MEYRNTVDIRDKGNASVSVIFKPCQLESLERKEEVQFLMERNYLVCLAKRDNTSLDEVPIPKVISHVNLTYSVVKEHYQLDCDEVRVIREEFSVRNRKEENQ